MSLLAAVLTLAKNVQSSSPRLLHIEGISWIQVELTSVLLATFPGEHRKLCSLMPRVAKLSISRLCLY